MALWKTSIKRDRDIPVCTQREKREKIGAYDNQLQRDWTGKGNKQAHGFLTLWQRTVLSLTSTQPLDLISRRLHASSIRCCTGSSGLASGLRRSLTYDFGFRSSSTAAEATWQKGRVVCRLAIITRVRQFVTALRFLAAAIRDGIQTRQTSQRLRGIVVGILLPVLVDAVGVGHRRRVWTVLWLVDAARPKHRYNSLPAFREPRTSVY